MAGELDDSVGDHGLALDMTIASYAGPGSYPRNQLAGASGPSPYIAIDDAIYSIWSDATGSAATDNKGGGSWTFTNVRNRHESSSPDDKISGTVTWTCKKR